MFGNRKQKEREAALRKRITVTIPSPTESDKSLFERFKHSKNDYLDFAVQEDSLWCVFQLLAHGADVNYHAGALQEAIYNKSEDMLRLLLQAGANRHKHDSNYIRDAIRHGNDDIVDLLLRYDAKVGNASVYHAVNQEKYDLAAKVLEKVDDPNAALRYVMSEALGYHKISAMTWIQENHKHIWDEVKPERLQEAVQYGSVDFMDMVGEERLREIGVQKLAQKATKKSDVEKLNYLVEHFDEDLDYQDLMQAAAYSKTPEIFEFLESKGARLSALNIILDDIKQGTSRNSDENTSEFEARREMLTRVTENLTGTGGHILSYMIEHNKWRTVEYLLDNYKGWPDNVIKKGVVTAAKKGKTKLLTALITKTDQWDAESFDQAMEASKVSGVTYHMTKLKQDILGEEWEVSSDDTIRRKQKFSLGKDSSETFVLSQVFNFKSAEVVRLITRGYQSDAKVDVKNFQDLQNDNALHEAYNKLSKFSLNLPEFSGAHMRTRTRTARRVVKRRPRPPKK